MDYVGPADRGRPQEHTRQGLFELPPRVLFQLVVSATPAAEIASAGPPVLVVRTGVIEVSAPGGLAAGFAAEPEPSATATRAFAGELLGLALARR